MHCITGGIILWWRDTKTDAALWQVPQQWWKICWKVVYGVYIKWQYTWFVIYVFFFLNCPLQLTFWINFVWNLGPGIQDYLKAILVERVVTSNFLKYLESVAKNSTIANVPYSMQIPRTCPLNLGDRMNFVSLIEPNPTDSLGLEKVSQQTGVEKCDLSQQQQQKLQDHIWSYQ